jgi:hypothetical protein
MVNYQKAKIYRLVCDDPNLVYYGATTRKLCQRLAHHKSVLKCSSKQLFDVGNVQIFLVENFPCDSKEELNTRERYWIDNNECVNRNIPGRTIQEWKDDNKEKMKEYYEANKEHRHEYIEANKEHIRETRKEYREANKESIREYNEANKEHIREYQKKYAEANKESKREYDKQRYLNKKASSV